jgi:glycerol-3-phosphate cytidylyltransferase
MKKFQLGYTTGTFDLPHEGHFNILKCMKAQCDVVMVGLVSDELGAKQKRIPVMSYDQRKCILDHCKFVDLVRPYQGTSKKYDHKVFHFDVVFVGDEYQNSIEYLALQDIGIPVMFIPRTPCVSTTQHIDTMGSRLVRYYPSSTTGCVYEFLGYVYKTLTLGFPECHSTGDVYHIGYPFPRNDQGGGKMYPDICGINIQRELQIHDILKEKHWYPVVSIQKVYQGKQRPLLRLPHLTNLDYLQICRANPEVIYSAKSRHCGVTLYDMWEESSPLVREYIVSEVERIIDDMVSCRMIHGDLHTKNICIQKNIQDPSQPHVSIIDFSWCQHESFEMTDNERHDFLHKLHTMYDLTFFRKSLGMIFI